VVVWVKVTAWVPPVAASVYVVLLTLLLIITLVAFVAATVRVLPAPLATVVGLAEMVTVGAEAAGAAVPLPHPARAISKIKPSRKTGTKRAVLIL
jgi:hypothetical protein